MTRNHLLMIFCIIIASTLALIWSKSMFIVQEREAISSSREAIEFATYAATLKFKESPEGPPTVTVNAFFDAYCLSEHTSLIEAQTLCPVMLVLAEDKCYSYSLSDHFTVPIITNYTSNGKSFNLSEAPISDSELRGYLRSLVHTVLSNAVDTVVAEGIYMEYALPPNAVSINPVPSIIVLYAHPGLNGDVLIHQGVGQVRKR